MGIFYRLAEKIYTIIEKRHKGDVLRKRASYDIRTLYSERNLKENLKKYYVQKIGIMLCMLTVGIMLTAFLFLKECREENIVDGEYIIRNSYGNGEIQAELEAEYENGEREEITLWIGERRFLPEELDRLYEQAAAKLQEEIFAEGDSADKVRHNLTFPSEVQGFPFTLRWESGDYGIVDYDGTVYNLEAAESGETVKLTVGFYYYEYHKDYIFSLRILPPLYTERELRRKELEEKLIENERSTLREEKYVLPKEAGGERIRWREVKKSETGVVLFLVCIATVLVYCMKDYDLHKQAMEKQEDMLSGYPEIVNRLVLYVGAGMTVRNAWRKIAVDFNRKMKNKDVKRGYVYREMLFSCHEMDSGASEAEAYENFGKRCGIQQYIKLSTLLVQNLQKGNSTMLMQLKEEAELAFEEKMSRAKKRGEEAGTKLLVPMMMMFGMVMIFIIIPAFGTFGV